MPNIHVLRHLGAHWHVVVDRVSGYAPSISPEGMSRSAFDREMLFDVDPGLRFAALKRLRLDGLVWTRTLSGEVTVFALRPETILRAPHEAHGPEGRLCSAIAGHALSLGRAEAARIEAAHAGNDDEAEDRAAEVAVHAVRIAAIAKKHEARGMAIETIRSALAETFGSAVLVTLVRRFPELREGAQNDTIKLVADLGPRQKRIANGLSQEDKALARIRRAGRSGLVRKALKESFKPKLKADELDALVSKLEADGSIVSGVMRLVRDGQPGTRYFAAEIGLPFVNPDGTAVIAI